MSVTLETHLAPCMYRQELAEEVRTWLTASPKSLSPKWFYDERGSALFDDITRLPEYYPTRAERSILTARAAQIAAASGAQTLIELGSGTSEKTRLLLTALHEAGTLERFVPMDVDPCVLREAGQAVAAEYPQVAVQPVVGDFEEHLGLVPRAGRQMVAFLGSTIGNLEPAARAVFLRSIRAALQPGDSLLLGTDLVKDPRRLVAAYDDSAGVTAQFNLNVLAVLNRELAARFDLAAFDHVARWDATNEWMEMRLRSTRDQVVRIGALGQDVRFARGEEVRTEISAKFRHEVVAGEVAAAGLRLAHWWTDPDGDFALSLSTPVIAR